jgi:hypothetical protein
LATKFTHKKPAYNRKKLAEKLEDLSQRVADRGIFVVRKNDYNEWELYDYGRDRVIFDNLPNKQIAQRICDKYNASRKRYSLDRQRKIYNLCREISKHNMDCVFYLHTMQHTEDIDKRITTSIRMDFAKENIRRLIRDLTSSL